METLVAPADLFLVALSRHVKAGEDVEVDDETAESLRAQGWEPSKRQSKTAHKPPADAGEGD